MSSAVEAISCPKVDVPAGPEPGEPAKEAAPPAEHCDTAPNGKCAPRCHGEEEADEDEDEEEEEKAPKAIDLGPMVSIKEQLEKDKDDESLRRWKEQLLGGVDLNSVGETLEPDVKIMSLSILSPGRPDMVLPLPVEPNGKGVWFTLKEGSPYRLKFTFSVSNNIVSGLRYTNTVWKTGLKVDRAKEMLGTFSPQLEPYTYVTPEDTTPSGMFARGSYSARTKFLDDDRKCYLEINYTFDIRREWPSTS
ncbi:Rho GDP-dissociation inhibitor 1 [Zea mays]|uniref:Rho GDP-dissociation inhibitor 1 n=2 Tax=Zea mays TaxID=4577 RepID=A0A3L6ESY6_MAIZE|nr:Rho GDP-dissociation inhibitor 1 [Zea mays]